MCSCVSAHGHGRQSIKQDNIAKLIFLTEGWTTIVILSLLKWYFSLSPLLPILLLLWTSLPTILHLCPSPPCVYVCVCECIVCVCVWVCVFLVWGESICYTLIELCLGLKILLPTRKCFHALEENAYYMNTKPSLTKSDNTQKSGEAQNMSHSLRYSNYPKLPIAS